MASLTDQAGSFLKEYLKQRLKNHIRRQVGTAVASHFATFWWLYLILLAGFLFFYMIAAVISSTQTVTSSVVMTEEFLTPQIYERRLENLISSPFGERIHPVTRAKSFHPGIDIALPSGTPVMSSQDGIVRMVVYPREDDSDSRKNAGIYVTVESIGGIAATTRYLHLRDAFVIPGQSVKKGQIIAISGNTGRSTGPHLHYELIPTGEDAIDPTAFISIMSLLTDAASEAAFDVLDEIDLKDVGDYDYQSRPMLYLSNVYMENEPPPFSNTGNVYTRNMNSTAPTSFSIGELEENEGESVTFRFGIQQFYGDYAEKVNRRRVKLANGETVTRVTRTPLRDPMTGNRIINLVNYENVLDYYSGNTEPPSIRVKYIPDAITVTIKSDGEDLEVTDIDYVEGRY